MVEKYNRSASVKYSGFDLNIASQTNIIFFVFVNSGAKSKNNATSILYFLR